MLEWHPSILVLIVGTLVALLGFVKWPRSSYELLHPRFVIPGIIWVCTFGQVLIRNQGGGNLASIEEASRVEYGEAALWYVTFSMVCFYLGLMLPLGQWISEPFARLETQFKINPQRLRKLAWLGTWSLFAIFMLVAGPKALGFTSVRGIALNEAWAKFAAIILSVGSIFNAALLGVSWPDREHRSFLTYIMMFVGLFVNSMYTMPIMSRGVGLTVFVAAMAYSVRVRRFSLWVMVPAVLFVALCGYAGLKGRGIYGRDADVPTYISVLVQSAIFDPVNVFRSGFGLNDCFTSLAVSMKAVTRTDIRALSPFDWVLFQIPIPHWFGITPEFTTDLTLFVGGYGTWGYTFGFLGDTFIHWGWVGALWFIIVGICYRVVVTLVFNPQSFSGGGISAYSLVLFASYYAAGAGIFNTYRAWVMAFFMPVVIVCTLLLLRKMFVAPDLANMQPELIPPAENAPWI